MLASEDSAYRPETGLPSRTRPPARCWVLRFAKGRAALPASNPPVWGDTQGRPLRRSGFYGAINAPFCSPTCPSGPFGRSAGHLVAGGLRARPSPWGRTRGADDLAGGHAVDHLHPALVITAQPSAVVGHGPGPLPGPSRAADRRSKGAYLPAWGVFSDHDAMALWRRIPAFW